MRSISMKHFRSDDAKKRATNGERVALGQIIGDVYATKAKEGTLPDGSTSTSIVCIGDFLATNYADMEAYPAKIAEREKLIAAGATIDGKPYQPLAPYAPMEANEIYLPPYFAEQVAATLAASEGNGMVFAVDVFLVPNPGQNIPFMYEVVHQVKRSNQSRLAELARQMAATGTLRIPLGDAFVGLTLEHNAAPQIAHDPVTGEILSPDEIEPAEDVAEAAHAEEKATKRAGKAKAA